MKKMFVVLLFSIIGTLGYSQTEVTIATDDGDMIVKKNSNLEDYVEIDISLWNEMMTDDNYRVPSEGPWPHIQITICITIASRKKDCKGGIGFRCGLTECNNVSNTRSTNNNGQKTNRVYFAVYQVVDGKVVLTFKEPVDWNWLQL